MQSLALTTDYLVAIAEEEDLDAELAPADKEDAKDGADEATESPYSVEYGTQPAADAAGANPDDWRAESERIEDAWLAGEPLAAPEAVNFLHILSDLHLEDLEPAEIVAAFDRFRARAGGERFSYCPLHGAVQLVRMRKPPLDNALVLVRYRELARPCKGLENCPGGWRAAEPPALTPITSSHRPMAGAARDRRLVAAHGN